MSNTFCPGGKNFSRGDSLPVVTGLITIVQPKFVYRNTRQPVANYQSQTI